MEIYTHPFHARQAENRGPSVKLIIDEGKSIGLILTYSAHDIVVKAIREEELIMPLGDHGQPRLKVPRYLTPVILSSQKGDVINLEDEKSLVKAIQKANDDSGYTPAGKRAVRSITP